MQNKRTWLYTGIVFAMLWSSAATATKIALLEAQPLVVAVCRFGLAAVIMLLIAHVVLGQRLPRRREWKQLATYALFNISIYLGLYVFAMKEVTASIGALTIAASPVFISFLSFFILKKPVSARIIAAIVLCIAGFVVVAWPSLGSTLVTARGLTLLLLSMLSYSIGTIYFAARNWEGLHLLTINGWQTLLGGLFLLPLMLLTYQPDANQFHRPFWVGTVWLAIPVSIGAVLLWLQLIRQDAVKAGLWLFLSPIFGILIAAVLVKDRISWFTVAGVAMVLGGLGISHYNRQKLRRPFSRYIFRN